MKELLLILTLSTATFYLQAQQVIAPNRIWDKNWGTDSFEYLSSVVASVDGGYYVMGSSSGINQGDKSQTSYGDVDMWVVKVDKNNQKVWDKSIGGTAADYMVKSVESDTELLLLGNTSSPKSGTISDPPKGSSDMWVVKMNAQGQIAWDKRFGSSTSVTPKDIAFKNGVTLIGGNAMYGNGGDKTDMGYGSHDYWVIRINASGQKVWDKTYGGSSIESLSKIVLTKDGGALLIGESHSGISGDKTEASRGQSDIWLVKINATGQIDWEKTYGGSDIDYYCNGIETSDGNFIVTATSKSPISGDKTDAPTNGRNHGWVLKLDSRGQLIWDRVFKTQYNNSITDIVATQDGGAVLACQSSGSATGDKSQAGIGLYDYWLVRIDSAGNILWDKTEGGLAENECLSLCQTVDGGWIVAGNSNSGIGGTKSEPNLGMFDYWLVKYGPEQIITGIEDKHQASTFSMYPNPAKEKVSFNSVVDVRLLSLQGQLIKQVNGVDQLFINELSKGSYLLQFKEFQSHQWQRQILIKE